MHIRSLVPGDGLVAAFTLAAAIAVPAQAFAQTAALRPVRRR